MHCAAFARLKECELNKKIAEKVNVIGTQNIVKSILKVKKIKKKDIKLVFISSDAVYSHMGGNHKETDKPSPHNVYGLTKLKGEKLVKKLKHYIIIRTRFFDKNKIRFKYSAVNIFTSALEANKLVNLIITSTYYLNQLCLNNIIIKFLIFLIKLIPRISFRIFYS